MGQWLHYTLMALWSLMMDAETRWWKSQCRSTSTNYRERHGAASPSAMGSSRSTCPLSSPVVQPEHRLISALLRNTGPELYHRCTVFCDWLHSCVVVRASCNPSQWPFFGPFQRAFSSSVQFIAAKHLPKTTIRFTHQASRQHLDKVGVSGSKCLSSKRHQRFWIRSPWRRWGSRRNEQILVRRHHHRRASSHGNGGSHRRKRWRGLWHRVRRLFVYCDCQRSELKFHDCCSEQQDVAKHSAWLLIRRVWRPQRASQ